jgi:hypothetical protein
VGNSDVSPYQAIGILERLGTLEQPLPKMACPPMAEWSRAEYDAALAGSRTSPRRSQSSASPSAIRSTAAASSS